MSLVEQKNTGFTLLEVMVAVLILGIGLLGLAQLQVTSLKNNQTSYMRSQASTFAIDMFERMRANQAVAETGGYILSSSATAPSSPSSIVQTDLAEWLTNLAQRLPAGDGAISCTDVDTSDALQCSPGSLFNVRVMWAESKSDGSKGMMNFDYRGAL